MNIDLFESSVIAERDIRRYQSNQGYVYLIHAVGTSRYKVGRSVNPVGRLAELRKQSPYPLAIIDSFWTPDAVGDEKALHKDLEEFRVYGEWFEQDGQQPDMVMRFMIYRSAEIKRLSKMLASMCLAYFEKDFNIFWAQAVSAFQSLAEGIRIAKMIAER